MTMKIELAMERITNKSEAREAAIDWQNWASQQNLSLGELIEWQGHFEELGEKYGLTEEFKENGII